MKLIILLLIIPFLAPCQTVHIESGKIVYKGSEKIDRPKEELFVSVKNGLLKNVHAHNHQLNVDDPANGELAMNGEIKLTSSFNLLNVLQYSIKVSVKNGGYKYHIDSVFIRQNERHVKTTDIPSEEILKGMDISGNVASNTERLLNEIDMDIQRLLDLLHKDVENAVANNKQAGR